MTALQRMLVGEIAACPPARLLRASPAETARIYAGTHHACLRWLWRSQPGRVGTLAALTLIQGPSPRTPSGQQVIVDTVSLCHRRRWGSGRRPVHHVVVGGSPFILLAAGPLSTLAASSSRSLSDLVSHHSAWRVFAKANTLD